MKEIILAVLLNQPAGTEHKPGEIIWVIKYKDGGLDPCMGRLICDPPANLFVISEHDFAEVTPPQAHAIPIVIRNQGEVQLVSDFGDYIGLKFSHIFIGVETDGYAHS